MLPMLEDFELPKAGDKLTLQSDDRNWAITAAVLDLAIIWTFFAFGDRPIATGMSFRASLQGCVFLSFPFLSLLVTALLRKDRLMSLLSASMFPLALILFPFLAFVSWLISNRPGPMMFLAPISLAFGATAKAALRGFQGKAKFLIWTATLAVLLGYYFWFSVLIYLGQKSLYVPCPAEPCHWPL